MPQRVAKAGASTVPLIVQPFDVDRDAQERADRRRLFALGIVHPDSLTNLPDARFGGIVHAGVHDYGVAQEALARRLRVSSATIGRWAAGKNAPHPYVRRLCLMAMAQMLSEEIGFPLELPTGMGPEREFLSPEAVPPIAAEETASAPVERPRGSRRTRGSGH